MTAYYNENDSNAAEWLRNLIAAGLIAAGDVDERSIADVWPGDIAGYRQCHFFAGIGGWPLAARLAGWPDDRELWTGSAPCQPFSVAGKGKAQADDRHLWPHLFRLVDAIRPPLLMGEQVAAAVGKGWLDGVFADLEGIGYACGAAIVPCCAVNAPHRRDRLWFVADADNAERRANVAGRYELDRHPSKRNESNRDIGERREGALVHAERAGLEGFAGHDGAARGRPESDRSIAASGSSSAMADADESCASERREQRSGQLGGTGCDSSARNSGAWDGAEWIVGHDGKARRVKPGIRLLVDGLSPWVAGMRASGKTASRQVALKGFGNAIVPQVAAEVIGAYMHTQQPIEARPREE